MRRSTTRLRHTISPAARSAARRAWVEPLEDRTLLSTTWAMVDDFQLAADKSAAAYQVTSDPQGDVFAAGNAFDATGVQHVIREKLNGVAGWMTVAQTPISVSGFAIDGAGDIYVSGSNVNNGGSGWTVLERPAGQTSFKLVDQGSISTSSHPSVSRLAIDAQGNVFAAGVWGGNWTVRKQTAGAGAFVTVDTFHPQLNGSATDTSVFPTCVTTVTSGPAAGIYVVGNGTSPTHWFVRRSTDGGSTWATIDAFQYSTANNPWTSRAVGVAGDVNGDLYVTGYGITRTLTGGTKQNPTYSYATYGITRKGVVDAGGNWSWTVIDAYPVQTKSDYGGVALDANGNVFTDGTTYTPDASGYYNVQHATVRSNEGGTWHTVDDFQLAAGQNANDYGIAADGSGTVYAVGGAVDSTRVTHWIVRSPVLALAPAVSGSFSPAQVTPAASAHHVQVRPARLRRADAADGSLAGEANSGVLPPQSHFGCLTYGQWDARFFQYLYSIPAAHNPAFDQTGADFATGQSGHVWFLTGAVPSGSPIATATRNVVVPAGTALFVPILNAENDLVNPLLPGATTVADLQAQTKGVIDGAAGLAAEVDGVAVAGVSRYRAASDPFSFSVPADNIWGPQVAQTVSPAVADGYFLILKPLSVGQHTVHFAGNFPAFGFGIDVTYHITVVGKHAE